MFARRRPVLRAGVVGGGAYAAGRHRGAPDRVKVPAETSRVHGSQQDLRPRACPGRGRGTPPRRERRRRMTSDEHDEYGAPSAQPQMLAGGWQAALFLGLVTLILGLTVAFHPTASLNVLAVLLGVLMI